MGDRTSKYLSYLIRLWEADVDGRKVWRASAESPHTGERHAFADLSLLLDFLGEQTSSGQFSDDREPEDAKA